MSSFLPAHRDLSTLKKQLQDSEAKREAAEVWHCCADNECGRNPPDPPPEQGPLRPVQRGLASTAWAEGWAHSRLLDVGAVRLQYRERLDGDVDIRQLRQPYDASEVWRLEWTQARACSRSLWRAEGCATPTPLGEAREAKARAAALRDCAPDGGSGRRAGGKIGSGRMSGEGSELAVPEELRPSPSKATLRKLFGYLIRTWLRRWVARLER